jgi:apolipoprotein D and lipocalin family protein
VVSFPGTPEAECPGPNYIVQGMYYQVESKICLDSDRIIDYAIDWAIVQTQNWSTLYILSRERQPAPASIEVSRFNLIRIRSFELI